MRHRAGAARIGSRGLPSLAAGIACGGHYARRALRAAGTACSGAGQGSSGDTPSREGARSLWSFILGNIFARSAPGCSVGRGSRPESRADPAARTVNGSSRKIPEPRRKREEAGGTRRQQMASNGKRRRTQARHGRKGTRGRAAHLRCPRRSGNVDRRGSGGGARRRSA